MRRLTKRSLALGGAALGAAAVIGRNTSARRALERAGHRAARYGRYMRGVANGVVYRGTGRRPDPTVSDDILEQRVRSELGTLEKRRDLPRVHVLADEHLVILHGEVPTIEDAHEIERRVLEVSGVRSVESYLHVGLAPGTSRPSEGRAEHAEQPSDALRALLEAARTAGAADGDALASVRAVLSAFAERIPQGERDQLLSHLPADARRLAVPPRRGGAPSRARTVPELVAAVTARGGISPARAATITEAVLGRLRVLVPEEAADVAAVLPGELRLFWTKAVPT